MTTTQTVIKAIDTVNLVINIEVEREVLTDNSTVYNVLMFIHDTNQPRSTRMINNSYTNHIEAESHAIDLAKSLEFFTLL